MKDTGKYAPKKGVLTRVSAPLATDAAEVNLREASVTETVLINRHAMAVHPDTYAQIAGNFPGFRRHCAC